ncbi:NUDIX domain-containing protein [Niabella sp. W65]|jgi:predicted NUDIX family NTP pyrophosphohydrolase|nr:NUDIX domain-containing protein [Niabella sp. W65]MCH7363051.1 NUDIX domain-containing protein [Niabella sp. W65]ULT38985.1 NUDIX domain-containing protein [Niabella sp. I65]
MKTSAGILLYKKQQDSIYFFLVHPGGPFWKNKDTGAWSIPKGEMEKDEDPLERARLEFKEETGKEIDGNFVPLTPIRQKSGKWVKAWAIEGDITTDHCNSNLIELEWPPRSGKQIQVPEVDRWEWFTAAAAIQKINPAQVPFLTEVLALK